MKKIFCLMLLIGCLCVAGCGDEASSVPDSTVFENLPPSTVTPVWLHAAGATLTPVLSLTFDVAVDVARLSVGGGPAYTLVVDATSSGKKVYVIFQPMAIDTTLNVTVTYTMPAPPDLIAVIDPYVGLVNPPDPVVP